MRNITQEQINLKMKSVLFVCWGNICRSPSAEAVFRKLAHDRGVDIEIDSAGTIAHHAGEMADARMQQHAKQRGYKLTSISRQFIPDDFNHFDMIIAMDAQNLCDLKRFASSRAEFEKVSLMTDYCTKYKNHNSVPDPYYGGADGFELVLDLLDDACSGLLDYLIK